MRQVPGEVVGGELVGRVEALVAQILRPLRRTAASTGGRNPSCPVRAPWRPPGSAGCRSPPPASGLPRCARRRRTPGRWPADRCPDRAAQMATSSAAGTAYSSTGLSCASSSAGIEEEEERRRGVKHVDGRDAAVGEILLGEEHGRAIEIGGKAMRGQSLAIGENSELRVNVAAGLFEIGGQFLVESLAALFEGREFVLRGRSACPARIGRCAASRDAVCGPGIRWRSPRCRPAGGGG